MSQTPLRISFFGGGTDFREYFSTENGYVLSSAVNCYIYVIMKRRFDQKIRIGYTKTELVDQINVIEHELVRECLRKTGITGGVEIATMADIPSAGSGMGSSSTLTVGLLNAMYYYLGERKDAESLSREACEIEIDTLGKPIGMQDQTIAAYGGQRFIHFSCDGKIAVESIGLNMDAWRQFGQNLMLFFTNVTRKSESILSEQVMKTNSNLETLREMKKLAFTARDALLAGSYDDFGLLLDKGWQLKKSLASKISNSWIEECYQAALRAGALGGKITGAGGGGFLLVYCPPKRQTSVRLALRSLPELSFDLEPEGTKIIFDASRLKGSRRKRTLLKTKMPEIVEVFQ
ncbi:MAG: GHMP kinase [Terriglobia bacterium]